MKQFIEIDSVIKTFGNWQLLTDVYLKIKTGEIIGIFGRNGTGKSVLMNILFGTMKADRKFVRLNGEKRLIRPFTSSGLIAYLPQDHFLPRHMRLEEVARLYLGNKELNRFYETIGDISCLKSTKVRNLSSGELRYFEIMLLLLGEAKFILLDEPFNYLAPTYVEEIKKQIRKQASCKGIVVTDHNYENVLEIADRILLIKEGILMELTDKQGLVEQNYLNHL